MSLTLILEFWQLVDEFAITFILRIFNPKRLLCLPAQFQCNCMQFLVGSSKMGIKCNILKRRLNWTFKEIGRQLEFSGVCYGECMLKKLLHIMMPIALGCQQTYIHSRENCLLYPRTKTQCYDKNNKK